MKFSEPALACAFLSQRRKSEIGSSTHNPFGFNTNNNDDREETEP